MTRRAILRFCSAIVLLAALGCGLSDYEKQMDKQKQRIQEFDELNRLLDDPLDMPTIHIKESKTDAPAWPFDFFLRLPKGFGNTIKDKDKTPYNYPFPCFRYTGGDAGGNIFIAAANVGVKGKEKWGEYAPDNFRNLVKLALEEFYSKTTNVWFKLPDKVQVQPIDVSVFVPLSGVEGKLAYDMIIYTDVNVKSVKEPSAFHAYFHKDGDKQIAIVVQRPLAVANEPGFKKSMEACLGSLDLSADAANRRAQFQKAKRK